MRTLRRTDGVSPVVAIIILVAMTVVLTSVLYLIVVDIARQGQDVTPLIFLGGGNRSPVNVTWEVQGASPALGFSNFKLMLFINETEDMQSAIEPLAPRTSGNVTFVDRDGGATLSQGDRFHVTVETGRAYDLLLFWKGRLAASARWQT